MGLLSIEILRRLPRGLLGMAAIVAACESYIARNDLKFSRLEPDDWRSTSRAAANDLPAGGVLLFGDSQVKFGFSPLTIESKLGQPAHTLAIQGGQATSSYFLLRKALGSGVMPSAIVVDFEPHLLRDKLLENSRMWAELADLGECLELAWASRDADAFAAMALGRALPSYLQRREIRSNIGAALRGETPPTAARLEMSRRNQGMNRGAIVMPRNAAVTRHDVAPWANPTPAPWAPSPLNADYARKFLQLARDNHIPVYCALMPVDAALQAKSEGSGMEGRYVGWLRWLQGQYPNLYVLDWRHAKYPPLAFMDALHLNKDGVASISVALGAFLERSSRGEGVDVRWVRMPEYKLDGTELAVEDSGLSDLVMRAKAGARRR